MSRKKKCIRKQRGHGSGWFRGGRRWENSFSVRTVGSGKKGVKEATLLVSPEIRAFQPSWGMCEDKIWLSKKEEVHRYSWDSQGAELSDCHGGRN